MDPIPTLRVWSMTEVCGLILNRHSQVVVPPECGYILWYYDQYKSADFRDSNVLISFIEDVFKAKKFETWELDRNELQEFLLEQAPEGYSDACALVHQFFVISRGKIPAVWGDKNNYYIAEPDRIFELYPEAKFLFLVRDPRDVFASYVDLSNLKTDSKYAPRLTVSAEKFSQEWSMNLKHLKALEQMLPSQNFKYVRYEDVIAESTATMQEVLAFLGLQMEGNVLEPSEESQFIEREPADTLDWKKLTMKAPDRSRIGRYRNILSEGEVSVVESLCVKSMECFDYKV